MAVQKTADLCEKRRSTPVDDYGIRFSVGEKRKTLMRQRLEKACPDMKEEERKALFDYLDTLGNTKLVVIDVA